MNENKQVLATNQSIADKDSFIALNKVSERKLIWVGILIGLLIGFLGFIFTNFKFNYINIIFIVIGASYPIILLLIFRRNVKKTIKKNEDLIGGAVLEYKFFEDSLELISQGDKQNGIINNKYSDYLRIVETKKYIFLYVYANNAQIINKEGFPVGELDIAKNILKKNCKKYKYMNF